MQSEKDKDIDKIEHFLEETLQACHPREYQDRFNRLIRAMARRMVKDHRERAQPQEPEISDEYDKGEVLKVLSECFTHPLFKIIDDDIRISQSETALIAILPQVKDLVDKLSQVGNLIAYGKKEGRLE